MNGKNRFGLVVALQELPGRYPVAVRGSIEDVATLTKRTGYDGMELHIMNPAAYDAHHLRRVADDLGLEYCGIATGMEYNINGLSLIDDDASIRTSAMNRLREHMDLAAVLGCPVIVGIMRSNIPDFDRYDMYEKRLRDALLALDRYADQTGTPLVVESITRYITNYLNTTVETADFISSLGSRHITLHIDTHSMNIEDVDYPASIAQCGSRIGYVHYSDSNRRYPGGGNMDFKPIHKALRDAGYGGYITVECLPEPGQEEAAARGLAFMQKL